MVIWSFLICLTIDNPSNHLIEVIQNMMDSKIYPNQILVEIDELNKIDKISVERFNKINNLLIKNNYELIDTENQFPNFLYLKS